MFLLKPPTVDAARPVSPAVATGVNTSGRLGMQLNGAEWKYVAEGGANVLFRHHPTGHESGPAEFKGMLLRVKKCDMQIKNAAAKTYTPHYPHPRQVLEYATQEIMPYLAQQLDTPVYSSPTSLGLASSRSGRSLVPIGSKPPRRTTRSAFVQVAQLLNVHRSFLTKLNDQLLAFEGRPSHRRSSQIDVSLKCVMLLPDVTLPPPDDSLPFLYEDDLRWLESSQLAELDDVDSLTDLTDEDTSGKDDLCVAENNRNSMNDDWQLRSVAAAESPRHLRLDKRETIVREMSALSDEDSNDADAEDNDEEASAPTTLLLTSPRLRRVLSSQHRNIFDCCFRNICVEIKPKIGFKPKGALVADIRKKVCRFCMHQHYKKQTGKVDEISEYCPLDLFSCDANRIRKALRALQRTPQNNFKVFVRSKNDEVVNVMTGLNADALPKGASQAKISYCRRKRMGFRRSCHSIGAENEVAMTGHDDHVLPDVVELLTDVLLKLDILDDLKQMQLLDHISVDGIWHLQQLLERLEAILPQQQTAMLGSLVATLRTQSRAEEDDDVHQSGSLARCLAFLETAMATVPSIDGVCGVAAWQELTLMGFKTFYTQLMQRFQVATTLKDCSVLLCLRRSPNDTSNIDHRHHRHGHSRKRFEHLCEYEHPVAFRGMVFQCVVAVVDLDVKSHKSVADYQRLDEKIVRHYERNLRAQQLLEDRCIE